VNETMLNDLKKTLKKDSTSEFEPNVILESMNSVGDVFLDDPETDLIGAEDDPEIKSLIDKLPEYNGDASEDIAEHVQALSESSTIPLNKPDAHKTKDNTESRNKINFLRGKINILNSDTEFYRKRGNLHQVNQAKMQIISLEKQIKDIESKI
jgi:hypothetical protein